MSSGNRRAPGVDRRRGHSGAKRRDQRPGLGAMLKDASRRKFDVVMAWAIDRLGRSLIDLLGTIEHLEATGVDLYLDQQNIDTTARLTGLGTVTVHRLKTRDGPGFVIDCVLQRRIATDWRRLFVVPEIADGLAASPKRVGTVP